MCDCVHFLCCRRRSGLISCPKRCTWRTARFACSCGTPLARSEFKMLYISSSATFSVVITGFCSLTRIVREGCGRGSSWLFAGFPINCVWHHKTCSYVPIQHEIHSIGRRYLRPLFQAVPVAHPQLHQGLVCGRHLLRHHQ